MLRGMSTYVFYRGRVHPGLLDQMVRGGAQAIELFRLFHLRRLVAGDLHLDLAGLALRRPGRAAVSGVQDVAVNRQRPPRQRINEPDLANLVFELLGNLLPGRAAVGRLQDLEALIGLKGIFGLFAGRFRSGRGRYSLEPAPAFRG